MENIPAGYQVHFTTWENDGDSYATSIISGLIKEDVAFYIDLALKFKSTNRLPMGEGLGNEHHKASKLIRMVLALLEKHPNVSATTKELWDLSPEYNDEDDDGYISELLNDHILSQPGDCYWETGKHFCRVVESVEVYFYPEEVKCVTDEFLKS